MTQPTPKICRLHSRFSDCGISCISLLASLGFLLGPFVLVVSAADKPHVERFDFGTEELGPLIPRGDVVRDQAGPRPPEFLNMDADNTAVQLKGHGARFEIKDPGPQSSYKFTNGDAITLEAWIKVESLRAGQPAYIIGKGRTLSPNFGKDNQNWSLRVVGAAEGQAALSFLFTSASGASVFHWHRWTSDATFPIAAGWHHVAVTYEFGKPETINGWIDGRPTKGKWDVDGPTVDPPVVDDDDVWIGTSLKGSEGNSFVGLIDMVAIHRRRVPDQELAGRFQRKGGPVVVAVEKLEMPKLGTIADGKVLVQFSEGLPAFDRWPAPAEMPAETDRWMNDIFLLPRVPLRYDDWGIRSDWKAPLLLRLAADVELPQGSRRFLLRARALARLWVDGVLVAETKPADASTPNGHDPVTPLAQPPLPGLRVKDYHHQEVFGTAQLSPNGPSRVVVELVAGGKNQRTETGEVCVAVETEDGKSFSILRAGNEPGLPLTDAAVVPALAGLETALSDFDDTNRRTAARSRDAFWEKRHDLAREWVAQNPPSSPPKAGHPIDAFIDANIEAALASNAAASRDSGTFQKDILPVLREKCFRCHGDKNQGGLKLNSRKAALRGGDSEIPAIVPGNPNASEMIVRLRADDASIAMPPSGERLSEAQIAGLEKWIRDGAAWPAAPVSPEKFAKIAVIGDEAFLRRVYLDLIGLPPTAAEARAFLNDPTADKRTRLIDRLLADERWAEHQMADWLDLLAENPTLINASLNSTGPFRWFLFDALRDEKGLDRMVTELMMMRGDVGHGGSAGFALAGENDSPFAAKGHIIAAAFLGIELQCARCHDSPYHSTTQRDLYSLAAMLSRKTVTVPATSRVPTGFFEKKGRESLIKVTLKPDEPVAPHWPFAAATGAADGNRIDRLMDDPKDTRERFAALVTSPDNRRFARVFVNRAWKRLMGSGFVEPAHDWEGREASHPELLDWLSSDFVAHGYAPKRLVRLIVTSAAYQREATTENLAALPANERFFSAPGRRRLTAEQIVDSLHAAAGIPIASEEITFVHDGRHTLDRRQTLGVPRRAWMFAGLNNERDRPSLALPYAQTTVDVLEAFGWNGSRQMPIFERSIEPNLLQPGILANGTLVQSLSRAAWRSELADLAVTAATPDALVDEVFLRFLCRKPRGAEREAFLPAIREGFATRLVPAAEQVMPKAVEPLPLVTWLNHVSPEANSIQIEVEKRVRRGPPADPRLRDAWREIYEDFIWNLINDREFVWIP